MPFSASRTNGSREPHTASEPQFDHVCCIFPFCIATFLTAIRVCSGLKLCKLHDIYNLVISEHAKTLLC
jgi:hypothetical protein